MMVELGNKKEKIRKYILKLIESKKDADLYWAGRIKYPYEKTLHKCFWCGESLYDGRDVVVYKGVPQHKECFEKNHKQFGPFSV